LADEIVARGLNTRQVEEIAREIAKKKGQQQKSGDKRRAAKNADALALEKRLADALGLVVSVDNRSRGGSLTIRYRSLDQLDEVVRRLERKP
jgi:ParB family transcriptional regulator, chromosome partitioning protein